MYSTTSRRNTVNFQQHLRHGLVLGAMLVGCAAMTPAVAQWDPSATKLHSSASSASLYQFPGSPRIVLSTHGNILLFQTSPGAGGASHIYSEGYILCYGGAQAYDRGSSEFGFSAPTITNCNGNSCTIVRNTIDNIFQLKQVITKNNSEERSINVEMTLRNLLGSAVGGIVLRRYADFDVDAYGTGTGSTINWWGASEFDSIYAWNAATNHPGIDSAMLMRHLKRTPGTMPYNPKVTHWSDNSCSPTNFASDGWTQGDLAATIQYNVGTLNAGQSAVVKVQYQRN
jgi:hypothetical protein